MVAHSALDILAVSSDNEGTSVASPGWVPQKVHEGRSKELCKGLAF